MDWLVELAGEDVLGGGVLVLGELDVARGVAAGGVLRHGRDRGRANASQSDQEGICLPLFRLRRQGRNASGPPPFLWASAGPACIAGLLLSPARRSVQVCIVLLSSKNGGEISLLYATFPRHLCESERNRNKELNKTY